MKRLLSSLLLAFLLTACVIDSPLATVHQWLTNRQAGNLDGLASVMVKSVQGVIEPLQSAQILELEQAVKAAGQIQSFEVTNSVPLSQDQLKAIGALEGYEVFYTQWSEHQGEEHLKVQVVKLDSMWRIVQL